MKFLRFSGALTLTHSASLILPGAANITTTAGDTCIAVPVGSPATGWRVEDYRRMSLPLIEDDALRLATAASTYLSQANAASTYLTQANATATYASRANNLSDLTNVATARSNLGLAIGTNVQPFNANNAVLNATQSFTAGQRGTYITLTDGATITPDFALGNMFRVMLGGNRTLANPTNLVEGQSGCIDVYQDSTGSRSLSFNWGWDWPNASPPSLTTTARGKDKLAYQVDVARSSTVTTTIATPCVVSWTAHGLLAGQQVQIATTGALPTGLAISTTYFVIPVDANSFQLAATQAGTAIATSGSQSGVHTMSAISITGQVLTGIA